MWINPGFGELIVPRPIEVEYPRLLELPPSVLRAHPKQTMGAEKHEALI
jgi:hypothetical protein